MIKLQNHLILQWGIMMIKKITLIKVVYVYLLIKYFYFQRIMGHWLQLKRVGLAPHLRHKERHLYSYLYLFLYLEVNLIANGSKLTFLPTHTLRQYMK